VVAKAILARMLCKGAKGELYRGRSEQERDFKAIKTISSRLTHLSVVTELWLDYSGVQRGLTALTWLDFRFWCFRTGN